MTLFSLFPGQPSCLGWPKERSGKLCIVVYESTAVCQLGWKKQSCCFRVAGGQAGGHDVTLVEERRESVACLPPSGSLRHLLGGHSGSRPISGCPQPHPIPQPQGCPILVHKLICTQRVGWHRGDNQSPVGLAWKSSLFCLIWRIQIPLVSSYLLLHPTKGKWLSSSCGFTKPKF